MRDLSDLVARQQAADAMSAAREAAARLEPIERGIQELRALFEERIEALAANIAALAATGKVEQSGRRCRLATLSTRDRNDAVIAAVCRAVGCSPHECLAMRHARSRPIALARALAVDLLRHEERRSLPAIAEAMKYESHSSAIGHVRAAGRFARTDPEYRAARRAVLAELYPAEQGQEAA